MKVINSHWVDPFVKCECTPYLVRTSEIKHFYVENLKQSTEAVYDVR